MIVTKNEKNIHTMEKLSNYVIIIVWMWTLLSQVIVCYKLIEFYLEMKDCNNDF